MEERRPWAQGEGLAALRLVLSVRRRGGGRFGLAGSAAFSWGAAPGWMTATTWSILTSSPSAARVLRMPDSGALTSVEDLVGLSVKSKSPEFTDSPSFLRQVERMPDVIDSPTVGTYSTFIKGTQALSFEGLLDRSPPAGLVAFDRPGCRLRSRQAGVVM